MPGHLSPAFRALAELLSRPTRMQGNYPEPPGIFRPYPTVLGPPSTARNVALLLKIAPSLQGDVKRVSSEPDLSLLNFIGTKVPGYDPNTGWYDKVLGIADEDDPGWVRLHPLASDSLKVLAHEFGHIRGMKHDPLARTGYDTALEELEKVADVIQPSPPRQMRYPRIDEFQQWKKLGRR